MRVRSLITVAALASGTAITSVASANAASSGRPLSNSRAPGPALTDPTGTPSPGVTVRQPRTRAERQALLRKLAEHRPSYVPAPPGDIVALAQVILGPDCLGIYEGPYPGGGHVWGEVLSMCGSTSPGTEADSKLYRTAGKLVDSAHDSDPNYAYAVTSVGCPGGKRYYRHEEWMRAGIYSWGHQDALNITC